MSNSAVTSVVGVPTPPTPKRSRRVKIQPLADGPEEVGISESLGSYDALAVYFSFAFHAAVLAIILLVLWMLDLFYLETYVPVDPLRAALAEETVLDDEPLMETVPLQIAAPETMEVPADSAVSIAKSISEQSLNAAQVLETVTGSTGTEGTDSLNVWLPKGGNAVTKGSFTAWTDPENPAARTAYAIIIELKLPERVKVYRLRDLSGKVVGTDKPRPYIQELPWDSQQETWPYMLKDDREYKVGRLERIRVKKNKIQIKIKVPGAKNLVRDTITLRSKMLREEQTLELVFGGPSRSGRSGMGGIGLGGAGGKGGGAK